MKDSTKIIRAGLKKRYAREKRFRLLGLLSIILSFAFLLLLLFTITRTGLPAFQQTYIKLDVTLDMDTLGVDAQSSQDDLFFAEYDKVIRNTLYGMFPNTNDRKEKRALRSVVSKSATYELRDKVLADPSLLGTTQSFWFLARDDIDVFMKGRIDRNLPESDRRPEKSDRPDHPGQSYAVAAPGPAYSAGNSAYPVRIRCCSAGTGRYGGQPDQRRMPERPGAQRSVWGPPGGAISGRSG